MCGEDPEEVEGRLKCCEPPLKFSFKDFTDIQYF